MYLNELNPEQSAMFLELAKHVMELDGKLQAEEAGVFSGFCSECALPDYQLKHQGDIGNVIQFFTNTELRIKRVVMVELFGVALADGDACEQELSFLAKLGEQFTISSHEQKRLQRWVEAMNDLVAEGYGLVLKD
ncbi:hypothetical protein [Ferrimonas aestuarii]|uniref:Tellurite resistance protein TerB n=1 Tax=Ferrimonas aestuarii TaxID=2569539 RepID=A0A4U1BLA3_9GAMM|nr:hypothetical protein [Ferrimonas aestuarii]TKB52749.1 hypothetical protein FCL42_15685 [Ferrimonas aestuarii]